MTNPYRNYCRPLPWSDHDQGVVDGDTIDLLLDLGHQTYAYHPARLEGVDTAEIWTVSQDSDEFQRGVEQLAWVTEWIRTAVADHDGAWPLGIETQKRRGKFGRLVAIVERASDGRVLQDDLVDEYPEVNDGWR